MDCYCIWCNLREGVRDTEFCRAVDAWLAHLRGEGLIESFRVTRRKLGFGPPGLGEFMIIIETRDLAQLEQAFQTAARRSGAAEDLHRAVYSSVKETTFALYRDFPDPCR